MKTESESTWQQSKVSCAALATRKGLTQIWGFVRRLAEIIEELQKPKMQRYQGPHALFTRTQRAYFVSLPTTAVEMFHKAAADPSQHSAPGQSTRELGRPQRAPAGPSAPAGHAHGCWGTTSMFKISPTEVLANRLGSSNNCRNLDDDEMD